MTAGFTRAAMPRIGVRPNASSAAWRKSADACPIPPRLTDRLAIPPSDRERMLIRLSRGMDVPQCPVCFKPFFGEVSPNGVHCTSECADEAKSNAEAVKRGAVLWAGQYDPRVDVRADMGLPLKACLQCEKPFPPYNRKKKFCCAACRARHWREEKRRGLRKCACCGEDFEPSSNPRHIYCSRQCSGVIRTRRYYRARLNPNPVPQRRRCRECHKAFRPKKHNGLRRIYCSKRCGVRARRRNPVSAPIPL